MYFPQCRWQRSPRSRSWKTHSLGKAIFPVCRQLPAILLSIYLSIYIYIYISFLSGRERAKALQCLLNKGTDPIMEAPPFMNSSKPIYLPQAPSPKTITLQISASTWIWGVINIQSTATWSLSKGLQLRAWEPGLHLLVVRMILLKIQWKKV